MAIGADVLIDNDNKKVNDMDILIDNNLKKITKAYVLKKGELYLWWGGSTGFVIFENGVFNYVPEGLDIYLNVEDSQVLGQLSEYYLTDKTLWVHQVDITDQWNVNGLYIDSNYVDYEHQIVTNAIYFPINRISNPEQLKVIAKGNLLIGACFINQQTQMAHYNIFQRVCNTTFTEYIFDINSNPYIDYIIISAPDYDDGNSLNVSSINQKVINENRVTHFSTPITLVPNQIIIDYDENWSVYDGTTFSHHQEWNVIEGWAYGFVLTSEEENERHFGIGFYSPVPFKVRRNPESIVIYQSSQSYIDGCYYCFIDYFQRNENLGCYKDENYNVIATFNAPFTIYHRINGDTVLDGSLIFQPPEPSEGYGRPYIEPHYIDSNSSLATELYFIFRDKFNNNPLTPPTIESLQQIARIEVIGGTIVPTPTPPEPESPEPEPEPTPTLPDDWETVQLARSGEVIRWKGSVSDGSRWTEYEITIPENCIGCIAEYSDNLLNIIILSKENFNNPIINRTHSDGTATSSSFRYGVNPQTSDFVSNYYMATQACLDVGGYSLSNVNFYSKCKYQSSYRQDKYGNMHGGSLLSSVEQN